MAGVFSIYAKIRKSTDISGFLYTSKENGPIYLDLIDSAMKFRNYFAPALLAIALVTPPVLSQQVDDFGDSVAAGPALDFSKYPVLEAGDWRSPKADIEWSTPIIVRDEFDGDYFAVLDKNYQRNIFTDAETGLISNWSRNSLRIFSYSRVRTCPNIFCGWREEVRETKSVAIKVGTEVFKIEGEDGNFPISAELAYALKNAPPGEAKIKVSFEGTGDAYKSDIGKFTVSAWKTVYQDAQPVKNRSAD